MRSPDNINKQNGVPRAGNKSSHAPRVIAVLLVIIACLALVVVASGFYVNSIKTVYPNVSIAGVDVSGMTYDEALAALINAGFEDNATDVTATISFPNGLEMIITGKEAGFAYDARDAARLAVDYGKGGSFIGTEINYLKALLNKTELSHDSIAELDEEYVRSVADEYAKLFNEAQMNDDTVLAIKDDHIEIVKSASMALASADDIYVMAESLLLDALETGKSMSAEYRPEAGASDEEIDLVALYNTINVDPVEAVYDPATGEVSESVIGVTFDMNEARRMLDSAKSGERVIIPLIFTEPEVTSEEIKSLLFRDVLSEKTTIIDGTANRLNNVTIAANAINGYVVNPGETFSFNEVVGKRTADRGYKEAGAYAGGQTVQEIGGGICQTSSTLYYCVLYADLKVVERAFHMFTIPYLPLGHDATISWGAIDFKFKNDTEYPVRIETNVDGRNLTVKLIGTKLNGNYIKTEYVVLSTTSYEIVQKEDESIAPGTSKVDVSGHSGCVVETYRYLYDENDNLIEKTFISKSSYRKQDRVILVPVGTLEPTETPPTDTSPTESPTTESPEEPTTSPTENVPVETTPPAETTPPVETPPPETDNTQQETPQVVIP